MIWNSLTFTPASFTSPTFIEISPGIFYRPRTSKNLVTVTSPALPEYIFGSTLFSVGLAAVQSEGERSWVPLVPSPAVRFG